MIVYLDIDFLASSWSEICIISFYSGTEVNMYVIPNLSKLIKERHKQLLKKKIHEILLLKKR